MALLGTGCGSSLAVKAVPFKSRSTVFVDCFVALVDRELPIGDAKREHDHGGAVDRTDFGRPGTIGSLGGHVMWIHPGSVFFPIFSAELEHGLSVVVVGVNFVTVTNNFLMGLQNKITGFVGLSGGILAAWLGNRFGNLRPIVVGIIFNAVFASTLALGTIPLLFGASYLGWNIAYYFLVPYMLGVLAEMDDRGRWVVAAERSGGWARHPVLR